ncbi:hypothetical protein R8Z50_22225 [Longispora sp. K20-0274]|uniref:hypothetical protein n=1 Tax=Longispora sp. K20-0274 TaxID=3088255 RepID=UPI00399B598A
MSAFRKTNASGGADAVGDEVSFDGVLAEGPFSVALDVALSRRRLSMESVQGELAARGIAVSLASLSYWRHGHRRPEGERSMLAVRALEEVLELPSGALVGLLGSRRPRGRWVGQPAGPVGLDTALGVSAERIEAFAGVDSDANHRLLLVSTHVLVDVDREGREDSIHFRHVVTARANNVDRFILFFDSRDTEALDPRPVDCLACRVGRIRTDESRTLAAAELLFDSPIQVNESYVFEYRVRFAGVGPRTTYQEYGLRTLARLLVLQVRFDPEALPVRCFGSYRGGDTEVPDSENELWLGAGRTVHIARTDARAGVHAIRWEWE